nr:brefeldin A-inhibited guanine nucleotide-exchange protein 5 [Tanacetum cinerariifolium]
MHVLTRRWTGPFATSTFSAYGFCLDTDFRKSIFTSHSCRMPEKVCKDSQMLVDLYTNYDCDLNAPICFKNVTTLSRIAQGTVDPNSVNATQTGSLKGSSLQSIGRSCRESQIRMKSKYRLRKIIQLQNLKETLRKSKLITVEAAISKFNLHPVKGIEFLKSYSLVENTHTAIREFLKGFWLPREAQKIDRTMEIFAEWWKRVQRSLIEAVEDMLSSYRKVRVPLEPLEIYDFLETLIDNIKAVGYVPVNDLIHEVEDDLQEQVANCARTHSEKLAISFVVLNTIPSTTIQIRKNLRVFGDCHNVTKYISLMEKREIIDIYCLDEDGALFDVALFAIAVAFSYYTRPPMLDRTDVVSWQQRIKLYCRGKDNRVYILKSIDEGPYKLGTFRETLAESTEGTPQFGPKRPRVYSDLNSKKRDRYNADIRATNILLQGLPKDIYTLINHYTNAKDIWDNVKMLLERSELTKEDRESQLYDEFEHFRQHKEESFNDYYVRCSKLINDMRNIKMTMPKLQLNSKFVNNMLPEWGRFVTAVKLNRGLRESNYDQLFAYLKQHEAHAKENKMVLERLSQPIAQPTTDPLALLSNVSNTQHGLPSSSTTSITPLTPPHTNSTNDLIENLTSTLALLTQSYRTFLPQTNNQLRTSSNPRNQATVQDGRVVVQNGQARPGQARTVKCYNCNGTGHIARNCTQPKRPQNSEYFKDKMLLMQAQENGVALDAEQLLFLTGGPDNAFDDDVDEQLV